MFRIHPSHPDYEIISDLNTKLAAAINIDTSNPYITITIEEKRQLVESLQASLLYALENIRP